MMKECYFFKKKNVSIFLRAFFTKMGKRKYAGGSRPSCVIFISTIADHWNDSS